MLPCLPVKWQLVAGQEMSAAGSFEEDTEVAAAAAAAAVPTMQHDHISLLEKGFQTGCDCSEKRNVVFRFCWLSVIKGR